MNEKLSEIVVPYSGDVKVGTWVNLGIELVNFDTQERCVVCKPAKTSSLEKFLGVVTSLSKHEATIDPLGGAVYRTLEYDTRQKYCLNAQLFVSNGKLSTESLDQEDDHPVGIVLIPPSCNSPYLEYLRLD